MPTKEADMPEVQEPTYNQGRWSGDMAPLNSPSGDRRIIELPDGQEARVRKLPRPLRYVEKDMGAHDSARIVANIEKVWVEGDRLKASGRFDMKDPEAVEVHRKVKDGFHRWVSVDLDDATEEFRESDTGDEMQVLSDWRFAAATLVDIAAFDEAEIHLDPDIPEDDEDPDLEPIAADAGEAKTPALVATGAPVAPPAAWFANPGLASPTPLTVTEDGRVYGHIASWNQPHVSFSGEKIYPPKSNAQYRHFHLGGVRTEEGTVLPVGTLFVGTGHAGPRLSATATQEHYANSGSGVAVVQCGEDAHGIWCAGSLTADATPENVAALLRCPPSGDWRTIGGQMELVAVLSVNVPGFPTPRPVMRVGEDASMYSLVAAGALAPADEALTEDVITQIAEAAGRAAALAIWAEQTGGEEDQADDAEDPAFPEEEYTAVDVKARLNMADDAMMQASLAALDARMEGATHGM